MFQRAEHSSLSFTINGTAWEWGKKVNKINESKSASVHLRAGFGAASELPLSSTHHRSLRIFTLLLDCEQVLRFGDENRGSEQSNGTKP